MGKTILMIGDGNFLAHISRLLEVGLRLRDRYGHNVRFAAHGDFAKLPLEAGFAVDPVYTVAKGTTLRLAKQAGLVNYRWWYKTVETSIDSDLEVIRKVKPDVVVGDMHWTLHTSCELAGVPYVSITNACWTNYDASPLGAFDDHFSTRLFGRRLAARLMPSLKDVLLAYWALAYRKLRKRRGLDPARARNIFQVIEGNLTLLADIPEYAPTRPLPPSIRYVGPILWNSPWKDWRAPDWLARLDPARPTVYFTLGSSGEVDYFGLVRDVFAGTQYQVIMTTGGLIEGLSAPDNIHVVDFAPGLELMRRSNVVLSHGGNGTIYQAILAGAPLIGIPSHVDQERNLQRVQELGFGVKLREKTCTGPIIAEAVERVIREPAYRTAALELRKAALLYDGPATSAQLIDQFLAGGS